jgi:hypothetical protein
MIKQRDIRLSDSELVSLYLFLRNSALSPTLSRLFTRIEKMLYSHLTIEELEKLLQSSIGAPRKI